MTTARDETHLQCLKVLDEFMASLNAYDAAGMDRGMHFPHVRIARGEVKVYAQAGSNPMDLFDKLKADLAKAMLSLPATKGFEIGSGAGPQETRAFIKAEEAKWAPIVRASGAVVD